MKMAWVLLASTLLMCSAMTIGHDDLEEEETSADGSLPGDPMFTGKIKCKICKWVLKKVKQDVDTNNGEKVTQKLHHICGKIPFGKSICKKYVHKYFLKLAEELKADDGVETICVNIKMCKPKELLDLSY